MLKRASAGCDCMEMTFSRSRVAVCARTGLPPAPPAATDTAGPAHFTRTYAKHCYSVRLHWLAPRGDTSRVFLRATALIVILPTLVRAEPPTSAPTTAPTTAPAKVAEFQGEY